ncbi:hypothetical protein EDB81DRAFT_666509 [Dactylonectria macrodidyma]|uniref:Starter acyltransferase (SAT) domain-containing protein n=1 Tax=Dactylonectria macrodidyma TaxID=307937 RepID=A0A9P9IJA2_9HYPO|nr:hypothetical protein EDB81DRAFT_666509 [Dactylonectria macrodidyma]
MANSRILFFGDLTETDFGIEQLLSQSEQSEHLNTYFNDALAVSRETLNTLTLKDAEKYRLDSMPSLVGRVQGEESSSVILRVLALCFAQIGHLIVRLEKDPDLRELWMNQKLLMVASCAGQLAASLAATTRSINSLIEAAPSMLAVSIRAAFDADRKTDAAADDRSQSWAYAVFEISMQQAADAANSFNKAKNIPITRHLYVGAASAWATTVIGPPSLLTGFFATDPFPGKRNLALPISTLFHAEHLEAPDLSTIVGSALIFDTLKLEVTPFISSDTGLLHAPQNLRGLAGEAVLNVNARLTDNRKVFAKVKEIIGENSATVFPIVAKKGALRLSKALGEDRVSIETSD